MAGPGTQTRKITISVDTEGAKQLKALSDQLGGINQATKSLAQTFATVATAAAGFLGGLGIRELASFSDEVQEINDRLVVLTGSQEAATNLIQQLGQVARDTDSSLQAVSDTYLKLGNSLKDAHLSSQSLLDLTETLINSFRLSGTSAEQAAQSVNQLAASFQLGGIKARDLRNIMKENTTLAQALRGAFGNNLFSAANDGFISVSKLAQVLYSNMNDINTRALSLGSTFSETLTKGLDAFKVEIFSINQALGLSGGFASIMQLVISNMGTFITVGTIIAASTLPAITLKVIELSSALLALNPVALAVTAGLAAGLTIVTAAFGNSSDIGDLINQLKVGFSELKAIVLDVFAALEDGLAKIQPLLGPFAGDMKAAAASTRQAAQDARVHAQALQIEYDATKALTQQQAQAADAAARHAKDIASLNKAFKPDLTPEQLLAQLNAEFKRGEVSVSEYADALQDVDIASANKKFRDGKINLEQLNEALQKVQLYHLNQDLRLGIITFEQFDDAVRNQKLEKMKEDLDAGRISLEQFNHGLAAVSNTFSASGAFRTGLQDYVTAIGTSTQQVAKLITDTFNRLEDQLVDFVKTGSFNFAQFTQNILDDLLKIIIRMSIIQPLAGGLLGAFAGGGATASSSPTSASNFDFSNVAAKGAYFDGPVAKFATGGIVNRPTAFGFGNGKTGLMGEAGPEAILPLQRGTGGALGVKAQVTPVTVNVINQTGSSDVTQTETTGPNGEKQIDILITSKVNQGIVNGKFDKAFKSSFGMNRKGT